MSVKRKSSDESQETKSSKRKLSPALNSKKGNDQKVKGKKPTIKSKTPTEESQKQLEKSKKPFKSFGKNSKQGNKKSDLTKPEDWKAFKKEKKELKVKRKQAKSNFDVVAQAMKIGEKLRRKQLTDGIVERNKMVDELHKLLKKDGVYSQFVGAHDTARIVQWLLKFSSPIIREEIFNELQELIPNMMLSKYGVFCVKRILKYGTSETRSKIIDKFYSHAVKFTSHVISAPCFEYAYSTFATPKQKLHLIQEFYGEMYKNSKDDSIKCLNDVFKKSPDLKNAALSSVKANLERILNKNLFDSGLVQSVIYQYLIECNDIDRSEIITQLVPHIVVISNSKDGSRAAMQCIWHGSNKDRKVLMKALKEHMLDLCKHEHGHSVVITLLDTADDTVILNKIIISEILKNAKSLSENEWGRKVLLWLVAPNDKSYFHPTFIKELESGRQSSTCKKSVETRRDEILSYSSSTLLKLVQEEPDFWLSDPKRGYEMLGIIKSAKDPEKMRELHESLTKIIVDSDWKVKEKDVEVLGIEDAALHLVLKKIAQHDKVNSEKNLPTFGATLVENLSEEIVKLWIKSNRGCFFLVSIFENNPKEIQVQLKKKLSSFKKQLGKLDGQGAKILINKIG